jgi:hypothetical protein
MKLLDTPQWNGLTTAQKRMVGSIYGNGQLKTALSPGARKVIKSLEALGLVSVIWRERDVTVSLREQGWRS